MKRMFQELTEISILCSANLSLWCMRTAFLALIIGSFLDANGQNTQYFISNGNLINIDTFNSQVSKIMDETKIPGMSLAIIENNNIVFYNNYGIRSYETFKKVNNRTVFEGCSLSKTFLVFVVYQLVKEKKMDLDVPLHNYLKYELLQHDQRYKSITARMILSHSSGLENHKYQNNKNRLEILSDPGTKYIYSGEGYNYLAEVIEEILGQSYEEYINERIIKPLKLKNTFLKFKTKNLDPFHETTPWNYATGHNLLGVEKDKWKNYETRPSGGNSFTAKDYSSLLLSLFSGERFTDKNWANDVLEPVIKLMNKYQNFYYGPGFKIIHSKTDTIIAQGGDNSGFKALMFYSPIKKRGFVFLTNSDRGKSIAWIINHLSVRLDMGSYLESDIIPPQYPGYYTVLLDTFVLGGSDRFFSCLLKLSHQQKIDEKTMNYLGYNLYEYDKELSRKIFELSTQLYPKNSFGFACLGNIFLQLKNYNAAYQYFSRAKKLHFKLWDIEKALSRCKGIQLRDTTKLFLNAKNFVSMKGVELIITKNKSVGKINEGDVIDCVLNVPKPGNYRINFRYVSPSGGKFELYLDEKVLPIYFNDTNKNQKWSTNSTNVRLLAGRKLLKLNVVHGKFRLRWIEFFLVNN